MKIPDGHWDHVASHVRQYIPGWERLLCARIEAQPDPLKRFDEWLAKMLETGNSGMPGVRLIFVEQPYLGWAETIEKIIAKIEKQLREQIAFEIQNPDMDY